MSADKKLSYRKIPDFSIGCCDISQGVRGSTEDCLSRVAFYRGGGHVFFFYLLLANLLSVGVEIL